MSQFESDIIVKTDCVYGSDTDIVRVAKVLPPDTGIPDEDVKLIPYLMKHRHGTPFEHNYFRFYVDAPIFMFRELHRHRIGFSYNEVSGRYKTLEPRFWIPAPDRKFKPVKDYKSSRPMFEHGTSGEYAVLKTELIMAYDKAYKHYLDLLSAGIGREIARRVLPVGIYSQCYVSCNARSLMHLLSLRVHDPNAAFVSYPQYEIEQMALKMEKLLELHFPVTYKAFIENGRVAP